MNKGGFKNEKYRCSQEEKWQTKKRLRMDIQSYDRYK
jgi:hypothetical protein